jgi:hypothetical protein
LGKSLCFGPLTRDAAASYNFVGADLSLSLRAR